MSDCIGPINIVPNNNQVILQDVNQTITIVDNNCCTDITVTQPTTNVVEIRTPGVPGPQGPSGSKGADGSGAPGGLDTYIQYNSGSTFAGSPNFTFNYNANSVTLTGSLTVSSSNTFTNIGLAQFTGSVNILGPLTAPNITGSLFGTSSWAISASRALTASFLPVGTYNITSSWATQALTSSFITASNVRGPFGSNSVLSASYALNGGVTSIIAGGGISVDQPTGSVTVTNTSTTSSINNINLGISNNSFDFIRAQELEQSKYTTINIYNTLNFI